MSNTLSELQTLARTELGLENVAIDPDAPFTDLGLDSLSMVEFVFSVEGRFGVAIEIDQALAQPTLSGLAALVDHHLAQARGTVAAKVERAPGEGDEKASAIAA